jgi:chromosome condensin MukBEF MukE localization factor
MEDYAKLERLLADGYLIVGYVLPFSRFTPESIANTISVFSIQLAPEILLDPSNKTKYLVMLRHPSTGQQVEIVTSDKRAISRANEQLRYHKSRLALLYAHVVPLLVAVHPASGFSI